MANRLLKDSIWTSPNLNALSVLGERHFYRLLPSADDFGCFEATPEVVKGKCYPLQPAGVARGVTQGVAQVAQWNLELEDKGLIRSWQMDGRTFAQFLTFELHNSLLEKHSPTTPCPPWMLDEQGFDGRLASDTIEAFKRIEAALQALQHEGTACGYRAVCEKAKCSASTLKKYRHFKEKQQRYTPLHLVTAATPKNPNLNPNPNPKKEPSASGEAGQMYFSRKKRRLEGENLENFMAFWKAFSYPKGKAEAADAWYDLKPVDGLIEAILAGAQREAAARPGLVAAGRTPKMAQGWLSGRRWEDQTESPEPENVMKW